MVFPWKLEVGAVNGLLLCATKCLPGKNPEVQISVLNPGYSSSLPVLEDLKITKAARDSR